MTKEVIAVITARSGSKSIPHKNIKELGGIPLLGWTIKALNKSELVNKIILSTDSKQYFDISKSFNNEIIFHERTPELASDTTATNLVLLDAVRKFEKLFADDSLLVLVQPTTPFITGKDIDECIRLVVNNPEINSCVSVRRVSEHPEWMITKKSNGDTFTSLDRPGSNNLRQNLTQRWIPNGGIYVVRASFLKKFHKIIDNNSILIYEMPKLRSMDIDEEDDFTLCEALVKSGIIKPDN